MSWPCVASIPNLTAGTVQVWSVALDLPQEAVDHLLNWLSADEKARAARLKFAVHQRRFIVSRGMLRYLLGHFLQLAPSDVVFRYGEHGKPSVQGLDFNNSDSEDLSLIAIAKGLALGVDVEYCQPNDNIMALAKRFFSPTEYQALAALPAAEQQSGFYRVWTRKEAFIKAIGQGLSFPLADFSVSIDHDNPRMLEIKRDDMPVSDWWLVNLLPKTEFAAALAGCAPRLPHVACLQLDPTMVTV